MPLYEYECKKCHHRFEKIQKFSDPHTKKCPKCGGPVEQLISAPTVQFKGSGFYVTDYPKKSSSGSDSSRKESKSKAEGAGKSESAPKSGEKSGEKSGGSSEKSGAKSGEKSGDKK